ncbi:MAG: isopeptide-forming domain-containing fimbrial protein [Ruminococcus sp.]
MKKTRKIAAFVASVLAVACMAAPMATSFSAEAASITITGLSTSQAHTFEVYQVFTGSLADGKLGNLKWGSGVSAYGATAVNPGDAVDEAIVTELTGLTNPKGSDIVGKFTLSTTKARADVTSSGESVTIDDLDNGYYIVKDVTNLSDEDDANSAWIVQVAGTASIKIKNAKPTVDKQVLDETGDAEAGAAEGWGESADHAINESFKFKLIANIPLDTDFAAYETYKVVFNDTMSAGVTYEEIESVTVDGVVIDASKYTVDGVSTGEAGKTWTLTIDDIKTAGTGIDLSDGADIVVIYKAHLNEDAIRHNATASGTNTNNNKVSLSYSNNPDATGAGGSTQLGKTPEDYVWVFTYDVENTKYADTATAGKELAGAEFKLFDSTGATEIGLIYDAALTAYRPIKAGETATAMTSADTTGKFNIAGLDAGTYVLKETKTPDGYNSCADTTIKIGATHVENSGLTSADLTLSSDSTMENAVINKSGSSLPSTGGIGTTIFYVAGGALAVGAGVLLITKKRTSNK